MQGPLYWRYSQNTTGQVLSYGYVKNNHTKKAIGEHFTTKGHKQSDMMITIIEKVHNNSNIAKLSSSWQVKWLVELRLALSLIITTPTHPHLPTWESRYAA